MRTLGPTQSFLQIRRSVQAAMTAAEAQLGGMMVAEYVKQLKGAISINATENPLPEKRRDEYYGNVAAQSRASFCILDVAKVMEWGLRKGEAGHGMANVFIREFKPITIHAYASQSWADTRSFEGQSQEFLAWLGNPSLLHASVNNGTYRHPSEGMLHTHILTYIHTHITYTHIHTYHGGGICGAAVLRPHQCRGQDSRD
jgi:hypothetical protein